MQEYTRRLMSSARSFFDIRRGEFAPAFMMSFVLFLIIATFGMVKPVRTSLFLEEFGAKNLPYVYIVTALVTGAIVGVYFRLIDRIGGSALTLFTNLFLAATLVGFWWAFRHSQWVWLYGLFFVWINVYTIMSNTVFWMAADAYYNPREAKRLYGFINSAGTIGGIAGGLAVSALAVRLGTENLLLASAGLLAAAGIVLYAIRRKYPRREDPEAAPPKPHALEQGGRVGLRAVLGWRYTRHIAIILGIGILISNIVDFQFNVAVERAFAEKNDKTAFLGMFFAWLNGLTFVLQFFLTARLLKGAGVGFTILLLPVALLGGLTGMAFAPGLAAAIVLRSIDGSVRYSVEQSTRDILYLPIPAAIMYKVKAVVDMFVQRLAKGLGSVLILVVTAWLGFGLAVLSIVAAALTVVWIVAALRVKKEYVSELRHFLHDARLGQEADHARPVDRAGARELEKLLESGDEEKVAYALAMLEGHPLAGLLPALYELAARGPVRIRARALHLLAESGDSGIRAAVLQMLEEERDPELQAEAVHYLCMSASECSLERLEKLLASPEVHLRGAALSCVANCGGGAGLDIAAQALRRMLRHGGGDAAEVRLQAARALGHVKAPSPLHEHLAELLRDRTPEVVAAALQSAGKTGRRSLVPHILERLCCAETAPAALAALQAYGPRIAGTLGDYLYDPEVSAEVRKAVAGALASIGNQAAADALVSGLAIPDAAIRQEVVRALHRLRSEHPDAAFDPVRIEAAVYAEFGACSTLLERNGDAAGERKAVRERIFLLLGLMYPAEDIQRAYSSLGSPEREVRATALEFLDNLLKPSLKRALLPVIDEETSMEQKLSAARALAGKAATANPAL